jgi:hypothetical protein
MVSFLVALAVRSLSINTTNAVLRDGPLPEAVHDALEAELSRHDVGRAFAASLATMRATALQEFGELAGDWRMGFARLPSFSVDHCEFHDQIAAALDGASRPYSDVDAATRIDAIQNRAGTFTSLIAPKVQAARAAAVRAEAQVRCLRVLNALARRVQADPAAEPKLEDLNLPAAALTDPFDGKLLHVKKLPEGWVVYSVGQNLSDDGGKVAADPHGAVTPDVGFTLDKGEHAESDKPAE